MRCPVITEFGTVCHKNPLIVSPWLCTAWLSCRPGPDLPKNIPSIAQLTVRLFSISDIARPLTLPSREFAGSNFPAHFMINRSARSVR
jgi:hypothetical protein